MQSTYTLKKIEIDVEKSAPAEPKPQLTQLQRKSTNISRPVAFAGTNTAYAVQEVTDAERLALRQLARPAQRPKGEHQRHRAEQRLQPKAIAAKVQCHIVPVQVHRQAYEVGGHRGEGAPTERLVDQTGGQPQVGVVALQRLDSAAWTPELFGAFILYRLCMDLYAKKCDFGHQNI